MRDKLEHPVLVAALGIAGLLSLALGGPDRKAAVEDAAIPQAAVPPRGWVEIGKRVFAGISEHRLMTEAAGVTFYALLAIFPALAALISLYGIFADPKMVSDHLAALQGLLPGGGMDILKEQVTSLTSGEPKALGFGALFGVATSIWSANQGIKALFDALNVVHGVPETRSFLRRTATTLAFTFGAIVFVLLAVAGIVVVPAVLAFVGLGSVTAMLLSVARWPVLLAGIMVFLALVYRFGPSRAGLRMRWLSPGGAFAAVAWLAGSAAFSWYVANFGSYNKTYGSLGAAVGFMTWIWISALIVLVGAELNAQTGASPAPPRRSGRGGTP